MVSPDHRPPTSPTKTTNVANQFGAVLSFLSRAATRRTPSSSGVLLMGGITCGRSSSGVLQRSECVVIPKCNFGPTQEQPWLKRAHQAEPTGLPGWRVAPDHVDDCVVGSGCGCSFVTFAYSPVWDGGNVRKRWWHLGPTHCNTCHAHCTSGIQGNASHNFCSSTNRSTTMPDSFFFPHE